MLCCLLLMKKKTLCLRFQLIERVSHFFCKILTEAATEYAYGNVKRHTIIEHNRSNLKFGSPWISIGWMFLNSE
jgi:hypothetical protein